ncbi:hypothetical protein B0H65DRAFT_8695 [Neurospora tetraspora]|uniref:Integral membrane protein YccS N-terminal domain-containing protein n=1 Tax=Neurospora tetraspora TaxID=94610 RepID=A0AAE0JMH9_9PEZI|nr:hypothetical protein B0H65DRAFT_8695 [Neurospora tetraspora]
MAPSASTAKSRLRKSTGTALDDSGSDDDYQAYNLRLQEASAARARLKKAREERDKKRKALLSAYQSALSSIQDRVKKSVSKYHDLHSAMHTSRLLRLKKAVEARDQKLTAIAKKLADVQRIMSNHSVQLCALYEGRRKDLAAMLPQPKPKKPEEDGAASPKVDKSLGQQLLPGGAQGSMVSKEASSRPAAAVVKVGIREEWEAANALC